MILVTGAGGKTGQAVVRALSREAENVRALVHNPEKAHSLERCGADEIVVGDQLNLNTMRLACEGVRAIYHICPNMSPDELGMAQVALRAAQECGVEHFVYHSVLHPQVEAMPHHWEKMRVEEYLFTSGMAFTVLQPGPYMQNVMAYWESITREGVFPVPYSVDARLSMVDLQDVALSAAIVLTEYGHSGAIYELVGPEALNQKEIALALSLALERPVEARTVDRTIWEAQARAGGKLPPYAIETLLKMFIYYENYGLTGNQHVLQSLLGRQPTYFAEFLEKAAVKGV